MKSISEAEGILAYLLGEQFPEARLHALRKNQRDIEKLRLILPDPEKNRFVKALMDALHREGINRRIEEMSDENKIAIASANPRPVEEI